MLTLHCSLLVSLALASSGGGPAFDLTWRTIDGGGGTSSGATFTLAGTIGQCDSGRVMEGAIYSFEGGFWAVGGGGASPCPADLDGSGTVDASDLAILLGSWGVGGGDLTGDATTDAADLAILLGAWGACQPG